MRSTFRSNLHRKNGRRMYHVPWARYWRSVGLLITTAMLAALPVHAADSYVVGYITRVSFAGDHIIIMVDAGVPTNCTGTPFGWMTVPDANKPMQAFVTGLWMRGDAASKQLAVYTTGIDSSGFCQISQIDTQSAG
jgi:hypothetical protein